MPEETFETSQPRQPVELKSNNWPKIILAAVLYLGFLAGAAYAGYWYGAESAKLNPPVADQISKPPASLTDWETYTNEQFAFRTKYPQNWFAETYEDEFKSSDWISGTAIFFGAASDSEKDVYGKYVEGIFFTIILYKTSEYGTEDLIGIVRDEDTVEENYIVDNIPTTLITEENSPYRNSKRKAIFVEKGEVLYGLEFVWSKKKPEAEKVFDQILSTFKFLD